MVFSDTQKEGMLKLLALLGFVGLLICIDLFNEKSLIKNNTTTLGHIDLVNNYSRSSTIVVWYSYKIDNISYEGHSALGLKYKYKSMVKKLLENKNLPITYDEQNKNNSAIPLLKNDFIEHKLGRDVEFIEIYNFLDSLSLGN